MDYLATFLSLGPDAAPAAAPGVTSWAVMQPYEKMLALSDQLGFTWERLEDGRIWLSRWDDELFRDARALIQQMDANHAIIA